MLTIRFNRVGKKNKAQFRIVVQEHTVAPGGRHVEIVGSWNPHQKEGNFKGERINYWISKGAQVSDSVYNLLVSKEIIKGKKRIIKIRSKKKSEESAVEEEKAEESTEKKIEDKQEDNKKAVEEPKKEEKKPAENKPKKEEPKK